MWNYHSDLSGDKLYVSVLCTEMCKKLMDVFPPETKLNKLFCVAILVLQSLMSMMEVF